MAFSSGNRGDCAPQTTADLPDQLDNSDAVLEDQQYGSSDVEAALQSAAIGGAAEASSAGGITAEIDFGAATETSDAGGSFSGANAMHAALQASDGARLGLDPIETLTGDLDIDLGLGDGDFDLVSLEDMLDIVDTIFDDRLPGGGGEAGDDLHDPKLDPELGLHDGSGADFGVVMDGGAGGFLTPDDDVVSGLSGLSSDPAILGGGLR